MHNPNIGTSYPNKIWLMSNSGYHVDIPVIAAMRFIEAYMGRDAVLDTFEECATSVKRIANQKILNRNFLSWVPSTNTLTQCKFERVKPTEGLALEFFGNATSEIFKAIDSEHASMIIYTYVDSDKELFDLACRSFGIVDPVIVKNPMYPGEIISTYHSFVSPVKIGNPDNINPPTRLTVTEFAKMANIVSKFK